MFYSDANLIREIAQERFLKPGHYMNLNMNDYDIFAAGCNVICAAGVRSEQPFTEFVDEIKKEMYGLKSSVDQPAEVLLHLVAHTKADVTMANYYQLSGLMKEMFGDEVKTKIGYATDDTLPSNHKDLMVFVAGIGN